MPQEIDLDQFTDEELFSKDGFGRESIQYLVEILKNDLERKTRRKHKRTLYLPTLSVFPGVSKFFIKSTDLPIRALNLPDKMDFSVIYVL